MYLFNICTVETCLADLLKVAVVCFGAVSWHSCVLLQHERYLGDAERAHGKTFPGSEVAAKQR